jgi:hypothetical protein
MVHHIVLSLNLIHILILEFMLRRNCHTEQVFILRGAEGEGNKENTKESFAPGTQK